MTKQIETPEIIRTEIDAGALFVLNHSGGKDSQAMTALVRALVPADQIIVVHAHLPGVDWDGTEDHARATSAGLEFFTVQAGKSFFEMVESRQKFPSPQYRQCTSDLKRGPIEKLIRRISKERGVDRIVNCMGLRAEESSARAKQTATKINARMSKAGRTVIDWLPIHDMLIDEVFEVIAEAGQDPHPAYAAGMSRLSCCFCIMASKADLTTAAELNPELYRKFVATEKRLGFTLSPSQKTLEEITGISADADADPETPAEPEADDLLYIPPFLQRNSDSEIQTMTRSENRILSYGGGVDSTAILAIDLNRDRAAELLGLERAELDARFAPIDAVVFADTGAEKKQTMRNVAVAQDLAEAAGRRFETVRMEKNGEHYKIQDHHIRLGTLPIMPNRPHVCSIKFKRDALQAWKTENFGSKFTTLIGYEADEIDRCAKTDTVWLIGYEADEAERCKKAAGSFTPIPGEINEYPLIELGITRAAAEKLILDLGWPIAVVKSSCVFCPFMKPAEIKELYETDPEGWQLARDLEAALETQSDVKHGAFLEADADWRAGNGRSPFVKFEGRELSPAEIDARIDAGETLPSARTGLWKTHTWNNGMRVYWGSKIAGKILSVDEWAARFDAEALEAAAALEAAQAPAKRVVHGLPLTGTTAAGVDPWQAVTGGSFLISFFNTRASQVEKAIEHVGDDQMFILDNGAFSAFTQSKKADQAEADGDAAKAARIRAKLEGKGIDPATGELTDDYLDAYLEWATGIMDRCDQAIAIVPDKIGGTFAENQKLAAESGLDSFRSIYVWHLDEPLEALAGIVADYNHIAFGSAGAYWQVGSETWAARCAEAFDYLDELYADAEFAAAYVRPEIHMLRGNGVLADWRFDSSDAVSFAINYKRQDKLGEDPFQYATRVAGKAIGETYGERDKIGSPAEIAREGREFEARIAEIMADGPEDPETPPSAPGALKAAQSHPRAIDLFAGIGGMTEGAAIAGVKTIWAANHWPAAVQIHGRNHPETAHSCQDLHQADFTKAPAHEILLAAPCCQGHAKARGTERAHHDASRATAWAVVTCAEVHRPAFAVIENVPEFLDWSLYPSWADAMGRLGYTLSPHILDAADHGVPQHRVRLYLIAALAGEISLDLPKRPHVPIGPVIQWDRFNWSPVDKPGRATATLERIKNGRQAFGDRFVAPFYGSGSGKTGRSIERPLGTVTTRDRWAVVDGDQMRMMQPPEYLAAMGFRPDYELPETRKSAIHMLGNAVCPPVAADVLRALPL